MDVSTTICPAKILSPSICSAIVQDETAVGDAKTDNRQVSSIFLNPNKAAI